MLLNFTFVLVNLLFFIVFMNIPITEEFDLGNYLTDQRYREYIADPNEPVKVTNVNVYVFYVEVKSYENVVTATITETLIDGIASNRTVYTTAHVQHINHNNDNYGTPDKFRYSGDDRSLINGF
eukprot:Pgem_evm1s5550